MINISDLIKHFKRSPAVILGTLLLLLTGSIQSHADVLYRVNTEAVVASDSDHETKYLLGTGVEVLDAKKKEDLRASTTVGADTFIGKGGTDTLEFLRLNGNDKVNDSFSIAGKLGFYTGSGWSQVMPGSTLSIKPFSKAYLELFYDRDLIDTIRAVQAKDYVDTAGISADYEVIKSLTVVGAYFHQFFRDGNDRNGYIGKLVYSFGESGFSAAASYKHMDTDFKSSLYFSPQEVTDFLVIGQYRRPILNGKYVLRMKAGIGEQWIDSFGFKSSKFLTQEEVGLKGWINDRFGVDALIGYSNNAGFGNYSRLYSQLMVIYAF